MPIRRRKVTAASEERDAQAAGLPESMTGLPIGDEWSRPVTPAEARSVPAVTGALQIIAGGAAALALRRFNGYGEAIPTGTFLGHPEPDEQRPLAFTIRRTVEHLALSGVAFWRVMLRSDDDRPLAVVNLDPEVTHPQVTYTPGIGPVIEAFQVDDVILPPADVLMFHGPVPNGWCVAGSRAIRTSLALEQAAKRYADEPVPSVVLKNRSGVDLPPEKVKEILEDWRKGRRDRATAYLNAMLDVDTMGFDARSLQLVEGRQQSVLEIARLSGVPSGMLASAPSGTSLTYRNVEGERLQSLGAMLPYLVAIETRLSSEDVTPRGQSVRFDVSGMMRPDTGTVVRMVEALVPLEVLTRDEGREFLGLPAIGPDAPAAVTLPTPGSGAVASHPEPDLLVTSAAPSPVRVRAERPVQLVMTAGLPLDEPDPEGTDLSGLVVPWNVAAMVHGAPEPVAFAPGSLTGDTSVRLVLHHDLTRPVGRPVAWEDGADGLRGVFAMGRSRTAADARSDALDGILDGFSIGADVVEGYRENGRLVVTAARLSEVSLVTLPAYAAARVGAARP